MYFQSREEAGLKLAEELSKYRDTNPAIVALSDGAVMVGAQIAQSLHGVLMLLLTEPIHVPGEPDAVAVIDQDGGFTYNSMYSTGELEEIDMDYHHYIEESKINKLHQIHHLLGRKGLIEKDLLSNHTIVLVSDGLSSGFSLDAAVEYLKTTKTERIVTAVPLATVQAVDRMHILADEIHCLSVVENYISTNHYYEDNNVPSHTEIVEMIENIVAIAEENRKSGRINGNEKSEKSDGKKSPAARLASLRKNKNNPVPKSKSEDDGLLLISHDEGVRST